jgi:hypothetical protein
MLLGVPSHTDRDFKEALGSAVVKLWAELPEPIQQKLFEHAVIAGHRSERDECLRQELARYLHEHNEPPRVCRRRCGLSHAASFCSLIMA